LAYFMSNRDRKEFKFRGLDNKVSRDIGCNKIFEMIYPIIRKKANKIYLECINSHDSDDSDSDMDSDMEEVIIDSIMGLPKEKEKKEKKDDGTSHPLVTEEKEKKKKTEEEEEEEDLELDTLVAVLKEIKKADTNKRIFVNELMYYIESKKEF